METKTILHTLNGAIACVLVLMLVFVFRTMLRLHADWRYAVNSQSECEHPMERDTIRWNMRNAFEQPHVRLTVKIMKALNIIMYVVYVLAITVAMYMLFTEELDVPDFILMMLVWMFVYAMCFVANDMVKTYLTEPLSSAYNSVISDLANDVQQILTGSDSAQLEAVKTEIARLVDMIKTQLTDASDLIDTTVLRDMESASCVNRKKFDDMIVTLESSADKKLIGESKFMFNDTIESLKNIVRSKFSCTGATDLKALLLARISHVYNLSTTHEAEVLLERMSSEEKLSFIKFGVDELVPSSTLHLMENFDPSNDLRPIFKKFTLLMVVSSIVLMWLVFKLIIARKSVVSITLGSAIVLPLVAWLLVKK